MTEVETDVLVVGGGLAALRAAYDALKAGARVVLAVKGKAGRSGSSAMTSAGYSTALSASDSADRYFTDTMKGGRGINDPKLVRILAEEGPQRLSELVELGAPLGLDEAGTWRVFPSGDHSVPRTVSAANHTGTDFTAPLTEAVIACGARVFEMTSALEVVVTNGMVAGAILLEYDKGELLKVSSPTVILGTGGAGRLFAVTSNPNDATGDGYALALNAGASLRDMEFIQFYPWRCIIPFEHNRMPIQPSTFVLGATLTNADGERFMLRYDPDRGEGTTRDVAARGIYDQINGGKGIKGGVRLDVSALSLDQWVISNPKPARYFLERRLDFHEQEMILSPEAHFFMGGVVVDEWGESEVPGLFAVGEAAGGVHGANRLDSNAIPETQVFGARAGQAAARRSRTDLPAPFPAPPGTDWTDRFGRAMSAADTEGTDYAGMRKDLQATMWRTLGIVRTRDQMQKGLAEVQSIERRLENAEPAGARSLMLHAQMANSLLVARTCLSVALTREESRGAHYRTDFPEQDDVHWKCSLRIDLAGGELRTRRLEIEAAA
jgi:succinate dehydrogenase/fumarate reductase flavoprotein subunit